MIISYERVYTSYLCVNDSVDVSHFRGDSNFVMGVFSFLLYTLYETSILLYVASLGPGWSNFRPSKWQ